jgi:hypothetical protein
MKFQQHTHKSTSWADVSNLGFLIGWYRVVINSVQKSLQILFVPVLIFLVRSIWSYCNSSSQQELRALDYHKTYYQYIFYVLTAKCWPFFSFLSVHCIAFCLLKENIGNDNHSKVYWIWNQMFGTKSSLEEHTWHRWLLSPLQLTIWLSILVQHIKSNSAFFFLR